MPTTLICPLAQGGLQVHGGRGFGELRGQAVDAVQTSQVPLYLLEPLGGDVGAAAETILGTGTGIHEYLVYVAEALQRLMANGEADGVTGAQGRGHDDRAEHDADDDEDGLGPPARDVSQAQFGHYAVPDGEYDDNGQPSNKGREKEQHDAVHGEAK